MELTMEAKNIRNFCIISHIDHGKSTLADRFLELTGTVEKRKMREQFLDMMDLERERGITIKMQPVRMIYKEFILNLIDTPGHIDFSYEVSRALRAVEGAILLVDATQGVQAQTIANVEMAKSSGLKIIPVINKIDLPSARIEETREEIKKLLGIEKILEISAKTGEGVETLLEEVIGRIPAPVPTFQSEPRGLVFDFEYSPHQGIIIYVRMFDGAIKKGDGLMLSQINEKFNVAEVGIFSPNRNPVSILKAGEIGYIVTNIKKPGIGLVGDSVVGFNPPAGGSLPALPGYFQPRPVVWASVYPESQDDFDLLKQSLERLRLSDSSLVYEEENGGVLGRGFRSGFLGMLHLEIIMERLKREFNLKLIIAAPTVIYKIIFMDGKEREIYSPAFFPDEHLIKKIFEPWVEMQIILPVEKIGPLIRILHDHEAEIGATRQFGDSAGRSLLNVDMPLRELMRNFFDELKSVTAGYGSLNYKISGWREVKNGAINRLDILVAEEVVPALSRIVSRLKIEREAKETVEKLAKILPRALFVIKIQAKGLGRIIASRSIPALKKDVTGYLYGGDRTRKMKLWQKQKRGKKKLKEKGKVNIPPEVFIKMMRS